MSASKPDLLRYLQEVRSHYSAYHNHKETSAWAAAALYTAFVVQISGSVTSTANLWESGIRIAAIIGLGIVVSKFIETQFDLRRTAANIVAASLALLAEYLPKDEKELPSSDLYRLSRIFNPEHHTPHIIPLFLETKSDELANVGQGARLTFERTIYFSTHERRSNLLLPAQQ